MSVGWPSQMGENGGAVIGAGMLLPPPEEPSQPRDWHASVTLDFRNHLAGQLIKAVLPYPNLFAIRDKRILDLLNYARKVEKQMFEQATDKEMYYKMVAEKVFMMQKALQENKNRRLNEQQQRLALAQQQQQQQHPNDATALLHDCAIVGNSLLNAMSMLMLEDDEQIGGGDHDQQQQPSKMFNFAAADAASSSTAANISQMGGVASVVGSIAAGDGMLLPPPEAPSQLRDWHASVTPDLRNHLVVKLIKSIYPYPNLSGISDKRIFDLLNFGRKVEKQMFEQATDKEMYYNMLAEKAYMIQKELQEIRNRRLSDHEQQQVAALVAHFHKSRPFI